MSCTRNQLNNWLKTIDVNCDKVGDIGVSDNPNKNRVGSFKCQEYVCFDVFKTDYCQEVLDLDKSYDKYQNYFDIIFCTEVFEHLINPIQAAKTIYSMLKSGGILYFSVCFIYPHHGKQDMVRFTDYGLQRIFTEVGFKNIEFKERVATGGRNDLVNFYKNEGMHSPELRNNYTYPIGYCMKAIK